MIENLACDKCELNWSPVCGIDGNTHLNECKAKCSNIEILCHQSCPCPNYPVMEKEYVPQMATEEDSPNDFISCKTVDGKKCKLPFWFEGNGDNFKKN